MYDSNVTDVYVCCQVNRFVLYGSGGLGGGYELQSWGAYRFQEMCLAISRLLILILRALYGRDTIGVGKRRNKWRVFC